MLGHLFACPGGCWESLGNLGLMRQFTMGSFAPAVALLALCLEPVLTGWVARVNRALLFPVLVRCFPWGAAFRGILWSGYQVIG